MTDADDPLLLAVGDTLAYCVDDHSAVMWAESSIEYRLPDATRDQVRILTAALVEALLINGLIHVGMPRGGADFADEPVRPEDAGRRILEGWDAEPLPVQVGLWMRASIHGQLVHSGAAIAPALAEARTSLIQAAARAGYEPDT
jgi:hypothetical protein